MRPQRRHGAPAARIFGRYDSRRIRSRSVAVGHDRFLDGLPRIVVEANEPYVTFHLLVARHLPRQ